MHLRQLVIYAPLFSALAAPWLVACGDTCTTDGDCAEGGICVNGQCRGGGGADAAGATDAMVGFDLVFADARALDLGGADSSAGLDTARPDTRVGSDGQVADSAAPSDLGAGADAGVDAGAADAGAGQDVASASDAAGPDVYSGLVGAPCRDHDDCDTPIGAYCLNTWPDGYCSAPCNYEGGAFECGQGAECYCEMMDSMGCAIASCYQTCWLYTGDCRDEYRCETPDWIGYLGDEDLCVPR